MANPFAQNGIDLSSLYATLANPGTGGTPGATGGTTTGSGTSSGLSSQYLSQIGAPTGPLVTNPQATPADTTSYWQQVASDLLAGKYTPYQLAAAGRGQDPNNTAPVSDAGPEANLPGAAYAGSQLYASLTPEQAAQVQYATPALNQFLVNQVQQGRGDALTFTRTALQQAYQGASPTPIDHQTYAGNAQDLALATQIARQADYQQFVARLRASGATYIPDQATYERGMGLTPIDPNAAPGQGTGIRGTGATDALGHAIGGVPISAAAAKTIDPAAYQTAANASFTSQGHTPALQATQPATPSTGKSASPTATPDYAAAAAKDRQYAANLAKSDPTKAAMYTARANDYESRITQPTPSGTPVQTGKASV